MGQNKCQKIKFSFLVLVFIFFLLAPLVFIKAAAPSVVEQLGTECGEMGNCDWIDFSRVGSNIIKGFFGIIGVWALIMLVIGGIIWITSGGNQERIKTGKSIFMGTFIGLLIVFLSWSMVNLIICGLQGEYTSNEACKLFPNSPFELSWNIFYTGQGSSVTTPPAPTPPGGAKPDADKPCQDLGGICKDNCNSDPNKGTVNCGGTGSKSTCNTTDLTLCHAGAQCCKDWSTSSPSSYPECTNDPGDDTPGFSGNCIDDCRNQCIDGEVCIPHLCGSETEICCGTDPDTQKCTNGPDSIEPGLSGECLNNCSTATCDDQDPDHQKTCRSGFCGDKNIAKCCAVKEDFEPCAREGGKCIDDCDDGAGGNCEDGTCVLDKCGATTPETCCIPN